MKKRSLTGDPLIIMFLLLGIVGCHSNSTQSTSDTTTSKKNATVKKAIQVSNCESKVINQEFSYDALAFEVFKSDTNKIKSLFLDPVVLKMEKNINDEGGPYYLHNFTDGVNKIVLFRNVREGFYIEDADIKNDRVRLNKKISIGMNKEDFLKLVNLKNIKCDTITVADDELTFESIYIFKNAKLTEVRMGQTVE